MGGERWEVSTASSRTALQGYELDKFMSAAVIRVKTRSGYPGHILSWSSKSGPVYKISMSDLDSALHHVH